jgi:hypothetical protein
MNRSRVRSLFRLLNRSFTAPIFRLGLNPFVGNPVSGCIMVVRAVG